MKIRFLMLLLLAPVGWAQTAPDMASAPHYRQLMANDQVRVLRSRSGLWSGPWRGTITTSWKLRCWIATP